MSLKKFLLNSLSIQILKNQLNSKKGQRDNAQGQARKDFETEVNHLKKQLDDEIVIQTKEYNSLPDSQKNNAQSSGKQNNYAHGVVGATNAQSFGSVGYAPSGKGF